MLSYQNGRRKGILERIARRAMKERGFLPDFSRTALNELEKIHEVDWGAESPGKDLRQLLAGYLCAVERLLKPVCVVQVSGAPYWA